MNIWTDMAEYIHFQTCSHIWDGNHFSTYKMKASVLTVWWGGDISFVPRAMSRFYESWDLNKGESLFKKNITNHNYEVGKTL